MNTRKFKKGDKVWVDRDQYPYNSSFFGEWGVIVDYPSGENNLKNYTVKFKKRGGRFVVQEDHLHPEFEDVLSDSNENELSDIHEDDSCCELSDIHEVEDTTYSTSMETESIHDISVDSSKGTKEINDAEDDHHDSHYKECVVEPILVMYKMFTKEEFIGFLKGNILKYRLRLGHKDDIQKEMDKIKRYEQWLDEVQNDKPLGV
jgi:hypothetical protein